MDVHKFAIRMSAWILTSFLCHHMGKTFMQNSLEFISSHELASIPCKVILPPLFLTFLQCLGCLILANFNWSEGSVRLVMISHLLATLATNTSMASIHTSSTFTIKLCEPVIIAIVCRWRSRTAVPAASLWGLVLIVAGALLFAGNPVENRNTTVGIAMAMTSSVLISFRNVRLKGILMTSASRAQSMHPVQVREVSFLMSSLALALVVSMVVLWLTFIIGTGSVDQMATASSIGGRVVTTLSCGIASGVFHAIYTGISTIVVLQTVGTFSHAIAGVFKRIATVLMLHLAGPRQATMANLIGLAFTIVGLLFHLSPNKGKRVFMIGVLGLTVISCTKYCISSTSALYAKVTPSIIPERFLSQHLSAMSPASPVRRSKEMLPTKLFIDPGRSKKFTRFLGRNETVPQFHSLKWSYEKSPDRHGNAHIQKTVNRKYSKKNNETNVKAHRLTLKPLLHSPLAVVHRNSKSNSLAGEVILHNLESASLESDSQNDLEEAHLQMTEFLKTKLINNPFRTNSLSRLLNGSKFIVEEARRVLDNILGDLIGDAKYAMLMEVAKFENKGDPAISVGELLLLKTLNLSLIFHCSTFTCTDKNLDDALKLSERYEVNDVIVFMQGGGNLVLYKPSEDIREKVLRRFSHFKMIILSQSLWFSSKLRSRLNRCQRMYSHHSNLTIFLRDEQSLRLAQSYFPGTDLFLAPDMAFYIGSVPRAFPPTFDIVWLRRHDLESTGYSLPKWNSSCLKIYVDDWVNWKSQKGINDLDSSALMVQNGLMFLQRGRVVITDRLHGHIMSLLLDIPHVIIDNPPARKLSSYHQTWTASASKIALVTNPEDALTEATKMLERYSSTLPTKLPYINRR